MMTQLTSRHHLILLAFFMTMYPSAKPSILPTHYNLSEADPLTPKDDPNTPENEAILNSPKVKADEKLLTDGVGGEHSMFLDDPQHPDYKEPETKGKIE